MCGLTIFASVPKHWRYYDETFSNIKSKDYEGGRFIFDPSPLGGIEVEQKIEPIAGRASAFTSGAENPHRVEKVESGVRLAFTMGFTCTPEYAINDPKLP